MYSLKSQPAKADNVKKPWAKPSIVVERSLEVKAQSSGPGGSSDSGGSSGSDSPLGPFGPLTT